MIPSRGIYSHHSGPAPSASVNLGARGLAQLWRDTLCRDGSEDPASKEKEGNFCGHLSLRSRGQS